MKIIMQLFGVLLLWSIGFAANGWLVMVYVQRVGFWHGLLLGGFTSALGLFLVVFLAKTLENLYNGKKTLPGLLLQYGELVAKQARRRCRR